MGFACRKCGAVTRTQLGMLRHCHYVHGMVQQSELEYGETTEHVREQSTSETGESGLPNCSPYSGYRDPKD